MTTLTAQPLKMILATCSLCLLPLGLLPLSGNTATHTPHRWKLDTPKTDVGFEVNYLINSKIKGEFKKVKGSINYDSDRPDDTKIQFTVHTKSIDTGMTSRDKLLSRKSLLNSNNYPTMTFVSKKVKLINPQLAKVTGDFTVLGKTKPLTIQVKLSKVATDPTTKKPILKFVATGLINRQIYGVTALPGIIGNNIPIKISGEMIAAN